MAYEQKPNTGSLFKNDYKQSDRHPDFKGRGLVNGKEVEIALWVKTGSKGEFYSLSFSEPYKKDETAAQPAQPAAQPNQKRYSDGLEDDPMFR